MGVWHSKTSNNNDQSKFNQYKITNNLYLNIHTTSVILLNYIFLLAEASRSKVIALYVIMVMS